MADERGQRLHPASILLNAGSAVARLVVPAILVLLFAQRGRAEAVLLFFAIPTAVFEIVRFLTVRYRFLDDELVVRDGVITRSERHIPFARIQNVDLVQSLVHRWLGVAEVRIETAGGSEPEAVLKVLSLSAVEDMRQRIFGRDQRAMSLSEADETDTEDEPAVVRLGVRELIKLGIISNHGLTVVAAAMGVAWEFDLFDRLEDRIDDTDALDAWGQREWTLALAVGAVAGTAAIVLLSVFWSLVRLYDFRLLRHGDDLQLRCGLLTRLSATIPRPRIQFVSVQQSLFHRLFRRASIRVETAGGGEDQKTNISRKWLVPLITTRRVPHAVSEIAPELTWSGSWVALSARGRKRLRRKRVLKAFLLAGLLAAVIHPWAAASVVVFAPLNLWFANREGAFMGHALRPGGLHFRSGVLTQRVSATTPAKIQTVALQESPFDRRWGMATVRVDTAGAGPAGHRIRIPYLDRDDAVALAAEIAGRAEQAEFRWERRAS